MSKAQITAIAAVIAFTVLPGRTWAVSNAVVGTCQAGTQFASIQAAVTAAAAGSTVSVCPGTYPEQVTILKNLTLKGLSLSGAGAAAIVRPAAGFQANATSSIWGSLAAQILVQQATAVTVSNIEVDGGGQNQCTGDFAWVGILFQGPGGVVTNTTVRNGSMCVQGIGLFADAVPSPLKLTNNTLSDCFTVCLEADFDDNLVVSGNQITSTAPTFEGIDIVSPNGPTTVTGNIVAGNFRLLALAFNSSGVTMTGNSFLGVPNSVGIYLYTVSQSTVQNNKISGGSQALVVSDENSGGGNVVTKNIVNNEACGMFRGIVTGDTLAPNTYHTTSAATCI